MKFYQRVLINTHSKLDRAGLLNSSFGLRVYSILYLAYKRYFEGRQVIRYLKYLTRTKSDSTSVSYVIDVGAHIGFFTRESLRFFPSTKVIAIEPPGKNSGIYLTLNKKWFDQKLVQLHKAAAWSFIGQVPFHFESSNTANNRFDSNATTWVPCVTIDSLTSQMTPSRLILKIDVQGYEFEVLEGAVETFRKHEVALIMEIDNTALQDRGKSPIELLVLLRNLGFCAISSTNGTWLTLHQAMSMLGKKDCLDFLFLPCADQGRNEDYINI